MTGFLAAILKNFIFIGYSIVEALVLMLAWNYFIPSFSEVLPVWFPVGFSYWDALSLLILIHFISDWVQKLNPFKSIINKNS